MLDLDVGIFRIDQSGECGAGLVQRDIGDLGKGGFEFGQSLARGLGARIFFLVEHDIALVVLHGDDRLVEAAFGNGLRGALLAAIADFVELFAGEAFDGRNRIAADALVALRVQALQALVVAAHHRRLEPGGHLVFRHLRGEAHHLGPAGDDAIFHAAHDLCRGKRDAGDAAATEPVERGARRGDIIAGVERGHAT